MTSEAKILTGIGAVTILIIIVGLFFTASQAPKLPEVSVKQDLLVGTSSPRIKGALTKVQIVEFGDFECPACAVFAPIMKQVLTEYGDKIDFAFRVIPIHKHSYEAAETAFAANDQGKFSDMYEKLYANQDEWSVDTANRAQLFTKYASEVGLDMKRYASDIVNKKAQYDAIIEQDSKDAQVMSIEVTPTTLILNPTTKDPVVLRGAAPYIKVKAIIEQMLADTSTSTQSVQESATSTK